MSLLPFHHLNSNRKTRRSPLHWQHRLNSNRDRDNVFHCALSVQLHHLSSSKCTINEEETKRATQLRGGGRNFEQKKTAMSKENSSSDAPALATFFVVATTYSWACWVPNALRRQKGRPINQLLHFIGGAGPLLAAVAVTWIEGGSVSALLYKTVAPCSPWVLLWGFLLPVAATAIARLLYRPPESCFQPWLLPVGLLVNAPILPLEEVGWRGFALPRIVSLAAATTGHADLVAAAVLGLVWSLWHAPLFFILKPHILASPRKTLAPALLAYALGLAAVTHLQHCLMHGAQSILPAIIVHATLNSAVGAVLGLDRGLFGLWWLFYAPILLALTHFFISLSRPTLRATV